MGLGQIELIQLSPSKLMAEPAPYWRTFLGLPVNPLQPIVK